MRCWDRTAATGGGRYNLQHVRHAGAVGTLVGSAATGGGRYIFQRAGKAGMVARVGFKSGGRCVYVVAGRVALVVVGLMAVVAAAGCAHRPPIVCDPNVRKPERSAVVFFVDGLNPEVLERLMAKGELPNISRRFRRGGVRIEWAVASLPSVTYANAASIVTGHFPGHHGILGNRWLDRRSLLARDYGHATTYRSVNDDLTVATLFDRLDGRFTVAVGSHTYRGASVVVTHPLGDGLRWLFGGYSSFDRRVGRCMPGVVRLARKHGEWPSVILAYFPGVDEIGHRHGTESDRYRRALSVVDRAIGRIWEGTAGMARSTYFVLLSDHGLVDHSTRRHFDPSAWLERHLGWRVYTGPLSDTDGIANLHTLEPYDAFVVTGAYRRSAIYLRGARGWGHVPTLMDRSDVVEQLTGESLEERLIDHPGIALVCARLAPDRVIVVGRDGAALIERRVVDGRREYRVGADAGERCDVAGDVAFLGLQGSPELAAFVESGWHSSREWLAMTVDTPYPDFVVQVVEMFDSPRAGDVVIFAAGDWSFRKDGLGGHGSACAADMLVPMYWAGPDLAPGGVVPQARLVDVVPTLLELLGVQDVSGPDVGMDGVSLAGQLRRAEEPGS